ncbi:MAG: hypothetical protein FJ090_14210 [Deltaproteobacteria bacterium]|nr:hypothetical protein [Deltaproteobacteria bacterium]
MIDDELADRGLDIRLVASGTPSRGRRQVSARLGVDLGEGRPSGWGAWTKKG